MYKRRNRGGKKFDEDSDDGTSPKPELRGITNFNPQSKGKVLSHPP